jgi:hypothetical protein
MKFQFSLRDLLILVAFLALAAGWWMDHQRINRLAVQQWEYDERNFYGSDKHLKQAGIDGWEACGVFNGDSINPSVLLKRPIR